MAAFPNAYVNEKDSKVLKKDITFTNLDGVEVTETYFFHLSKADLIRMETSVDGGLGDHLTKIIQGSSDKVIMAEFEKLILASYGTKSEDGNRFIKSDQAREEFKQTEAYADLLMELCTDEGAATAFIQGIVPHNLRGDIAKIAAKNKMKTEVPTPIVDPTHEGPESVTNPTVAEQMAGQVKQRVLTVTEAQHMNPDELNHLIATGQAVFGQ